MKMMHYLALAAAAVLPVMGQQSLPAAGDADHAAVTETAAERDARMAWWRGAKFGMFIHYGLYSGLGGFFKGKFGGGEWIQRNLRLDTETYAAEAEPLFRPAEGCTEEWAKLAEEAGCRYMVLTSKHHEGFALFDAPNSDYSSMKLVGRDLVREFAESARKHGMRVGLYHSVIDWHQKDYDNTICPDLCYPEDQAQMLKDRGIPRNHAAYQQYLHEQVRTLLTKYGKIDILWWDYSQGAAAGERGWKAPALMTMCRELQPGVIMNNRLYSFSGFDKSRDGVQLDLRCGDYTTPEKRIPEKGYPGIDWEACMTVGDKWGYCKVDWKLKSPAVIIRQLQECAAKGGNLLLNIGPKADGSVPPRVAEIFRSVGAWMRVNGEAIYGSRPAYDISLPEGCLASRAGGALYIFLPQQKDPGELLLPAELAKNATISVLGQPDAPVTADDKGIHVPASVRAAAPEGLPVLKITPCH